MARFCRSGRHCRHLRAHHAVSTTPGPARPRRQRRSPGFVDPIGNDYIIDTGEWKRQSVRAATPRPTDMSARCAAALRARPWICEAWARDAEGSRRAVAAGGRRGPPRAVSPVGVRWWRAIPPGGRCGRLIASAGQAGSGPSPKAGRPPTTVWSSGRSGTASGGTPVGSPPRMTRSANLPASSVPTSSSTQASQAASRV